MRTLSASLRLCLLSFGLLAGCSSSKPAPDKAEAVVVIHGLGRTPTSMKLLASRIEDAGYSVTNFGYPSKSEPIEELTSLLAAELEERFGEDAKSVHFVTHSMGGILTGRRLAEGDARIRSAVTVGSALDYSGTKSIFHLAKKLVWASWLIWPPVLPMGPAGLVLAFDARPRSCSRRK